MSNTFSVIWSVRSKNKTDKILEYLRENWSEKEVIKYLSRLKNFESIVIRFPELFPVSETHPKKYHKAVISKHYSIIYRIDSKIIKVVTILDNREQNA